VSILALLALLVLLLLGTAGPGATVGYESTSVPASIGTLEAEQGWAHPEWFADPAWLEQHLADPTVTVVALTPEEEFLAGHIPGAVQIDWPALEIVETSGGSLAAWRSEVEGILTRLGITPADTVVIYDGGSFYAARLWWVLDQLGHADKRILDGGLPAWQSAGMPLEAAGTWVGHSPADPYVGTPNEEAIATIEEVEAAVSDPGVALVDARSPEEYAEHTRVPGDAVDSGYERSGQHLWFSKDRRLAYVGSEADAQAWPRAVRPIRCA
jgi:thiosulfate/3-mercaptopyruvate sulfurtransferase